MSEPQLIEIRLDNSPSALARVLLAFSRRRIRISELAMLDDGDQPALVRLGCTLEAGALEHLALQLRRMVEVRAVVRVGSLALEEQTAG